MGTSGFLATIPIHRAFIDEKAYLSSIGKKIDEGISGIFLKDFLKDFLKENNIEFTERQRYILWILSKNQSLSGKAIAKKISEMTSGNISVSERTIRMDIADLQSKGILSREGGRKDGRWVIKKS